MPDSARLDRLRDYYQRHRAMPTYDGLAVLMGYRSKAAAFKLAARLSTAGFLNTGPGQRIVPTDQFLARPIAGSVRAGHPEAPSETLFESVSLDSLLIDTPSTTVFVRVTGDSMIESGIMDGDLAIIDRGLKARIGDIVVAMWDGETTIKELAIDGRGRTILKCHHPTMPPLIPKGTLEVLGVYVGLARRHRRNRLKNSPTFSMQKRRGGR